jgi:type I restriction enzyme S subunit
MMDEAEVTALSASSATLRQSVLTLAFSGGLVPQDPHDEPATILLERLRADRPAGKKRGRRGRNASLQESAR